MGNPNQHMDFVLKNGMDAWSLTDHGHMNGFAEAYLYAEKMKKAGKKFKLIPGCEMYVHPDLEQWKRDKLEAEELAKDAKAAKLAAKKEREKVKTNIERIGDEDDETVAVETNNSLTIENEDETKSGKSFNPVNRRHHLVVLPKTSGALLKIFHLVSRGYLEGFYRFPRIDLGMLREAAKDDDIIISSACLGGIFSHEVFTQLRQVSFDKMDARLLDDPSLMNAVVGAIGNSFDMYADAVGRHNMFLELQFNRLPAQDVVNRAIIEFARRNSLTNQLVVTADSHYAGPDLWYHREMYKKLGYLNFGDYGPDTLPKSKDDIKADLYPKNAEQIWQEYQDAKGRQEFYSDCDDLICEAVERTHDIAHNLIGDIKLDTNYRYPSSIIPKDKTPFEVLLGQCKEGLMKRGLADKPEYVERLKHELGVIKQMDNAAYFVTLAKALQLARDVCLLGVARGSSGGSLVAYVLEITDLDPIKYECRFDRFLSVHRCLHPDTLVKTEDGQKRIGDINVNDKLVGGSGVVRNVNKKFITKTDRIIRIQCGENVFQCSENHKWLVERDGNKIEVLADLILKSDRLLIADFHNSLITYRPTKIDELEVYTLQHQVDLVDIEVDVDHTFFVSSTGNNWVLTHNSGAPDIDVDIGDRDAVLDVLRKEFGGNNIVPISNMNTFKVKTLVKDISKFYGIPFDEVNAATKTVEQDVRKATMKHGDDKNLFVLTFDDAMQYSPTFKEFIDKHPQVADSINILFKEQRSLGRHAGGVLILDDAPHQIPLITNAGEPQTPWVEGVGQKTLEPLGYIKYDLLGLETMRLIGRTVELILQGKNKVREIELDNGRVLRLSGDQVVETTTGPKRVSELTESDEISDEWIQAAHTAIS